MSSETSEVTALDGTLVARTTTADDVASRLVVTWANYPGDVTAAVVELIDRAVPMGPNTIGEWLWPVSASFDPARQRTRVGFSYLPPATHRGVA